MNWQEELVNVNSWQELVRVSEQLGLWRCGLDGVLAGWQRGLSWSDS